MRLRQFRSERLSRRQSPMDRQSTESIEKWDYALRGPGEIIYNPHADERGIIVSRIVVATYGPGECVHKIELTLDIGIISTLPDLHVAKRDERLAFFRTIRGRGREEN